MSVRKSTKSVVFKVGEFFSGPGGFACGANDAANSMAEKGPKISIVHAWAVDYDRDSCLTYAANILGHKDPATLPDRVLNKSVVNLAKEGFASLPKGLVDIFAFGFPCNDFSLVGEKLGTRGKFGPLYTYGVKLIECKRPDVFIAENVGGLRSADGGRALRCIIDELAGAGDGYVVYAHYYKFEQYGVPQTRHRVILVGVKKTLHAKLGPYKVPKPSTPEPISVKQALKDITPGDSKYENNEFTRQSAAVVERLKCIQPGENAWNSKIPDARLRLNVKGARMSQIYRRLHPDKPSYTITGSGGGGTHVYHWDEPRALTNRERAVIQTFPMSYVFKGSKESVRKQIGMAVPPKAASMIFRSVFMYLMKISYPCLESPSLGIYHDNRKDT